MAKRKSDLSMNMNNIKSGVQSTDINSVVQEEKNVLTGILEGQLNEKHTNLNKLSGARTKIIYFRQVPSTENDSMINLSGFNSADPNLGRYLRIDDLSVKMDEIDNTFDETEGNGPESYGSEGKMIVLPNTILPLPNDFFLLKFHDKVRCFQINKVTPLSVDTESAYEVNFNLKDNDFVYAGSELEKMVVEEYTFDEIYLGTSFRTIYKKSEYKLLNDIKELYNDIGRSYKEYFWDNSLETYVLQYFDNLIETYGGPMQKINERRCIVIGEGGETYDNALIRSREYEFKDMYTGKRMYDGDLIEFIIKNRIFDSIENFPVIPSQYSYERRPLAYNNTIFYSLETKSRKRFLNRYHLPVELNMASPGSQPVLYGLVNLLHVSSPTHLTMNLFPETLYDIVHNQVTEIPVKEINKYNVFSVIEYIISLYINNKLTNITDLLSYVYEHKEEIEMFSTNIIQHQAFYIIPVLGFIIKCVANEIVSTNSKDNDIKDPLIYNKIKITE